MKKARTKNPQKQHRYLNLTYIRNIHTGKQLHVYEQHD